MSKMLISGLINVETTLKVGGFPIEYSPIFYPSFGVNTNVAGVGYNVAKALKTLGDDVEIASIIGRDEEGTRIYRTFENNGLSTKFLKRDLLVTSQSVILYDESGRRQIYCDLKDIQEKAYENSELDKVLEDCSLVMACNINFSRPLLKKAKDKEILIATDVHVLSDIKDEYNKDFMENADILFLSDEKIPVKVSDFVEELKKAFPSKIIVVGLGEKGALIYIRAEEAMYKVDAVFTRKVINTVGAGDSLFSAFLHYYCKKLPAMECLKRAMTFASYKIGETGAANGFLSEEALEDIYKKLDFHVSEITFK